METNSQDKRPKPTKKATKRPYAGKKDDGHNRTAAATSCNLFFQFFQ